MTKWFELIFFIKLAAKVGEGGGEVGVVANRNFKSKKK